jgi:hypothetical protein
LDENYRRRTAQKRPKTEYYHAAQRLSVTKSQFRANFQTDQYGKRKRLPLNFPRCTNLLSCHKQVMGILILIRCLDKTVIFVVFWQRECSGVESVLSDECFV